MTDFSVLLHERRTEDCSDPGRSETVQGDYRKGMWCRGKS